jgi:hypothetical protein
MAYSRHKSEPDHSTRGPVHSACRRGRSARAGYHAQGEHALSGAAVDHYTPGAGRHARDQQTRARRADGSARNQRVIIRSIEVKRVDDLVGFHADRISDLDRDHLQAHAILHVPFRFGHFRPSCAQMLIDRVLSVIGLEFFVAGVMRQRYPSLARAYVRAKFIVAFPCWTSQS